jgi:hypothetical protein
MSGLDASRAVIQLVVFVVVFVLVVGAVPV